MNEIQMGTHIVIGVCSASEDQMEGRIGLTAVAGEGIVVAVGVVAVGVVVVVVVVEVVVAVFAAAVMTAVGAELERACRDRLRRSPGRRKTTQRAGTSSPLL